MVAAQDRFPVAVKLELPVIPYQVDGYAFGQRVRSRIFLIARHLGEDVLAAAGTAVKSCGLGKVVWSEMRLGSPEKPNWGGIIIVGHEHAVSGQVFYSLYGHVKNLQVQVDDAVTAGQNLGYIAPGRTPENGWWKKPHLHFAIYEGPWMEQVLPGYARPFEDRTRFKWWRPPRTFIEQYNLAVGSEVPDS